MSTSYKITENEQVAEPETKLHITILKEDWLDPKWSPTHQLWCLNDAGVEHHPFRFRPDIQDQGNGRTNIWECQLYPNFLVSLNRYPDKSAIFSILFSNFGYSSRSTRRERSSCIFLTEQTRGEMQKAKAGRCTHWNSWFAIRPNLATLYCPWRSALWLNIDWWETDPSRPRVVYHVETVDETRKFEK